MFSETALKLNISIAWFICVPHCTQSALLISQLSHFGIWSIGGNKKLHWSIFESYTRKLVLFAQHKWYVLSFTPSNCSCYYISSPGDKI